MKRKLLLFALILIIVFASILVYLQLNIEWEKDKFVGEWQDPKLIGDNWAFFSDRSFGVQTADVWRNDGFYDIKGDKLIITLPNNEGTEEYYYIFSDNNQVLTLYLDDPPAPVYREYNKIIS